MQFRKIICVLTEVIGLQAQDHFTLTSAHLPTIIIEKKSGRLKINAEKHSKTNLVGSGVFVGKDLQPK